MRRLLPAAFLASFVVLVASISADADEPIVPSEHQGPPGTVISIANVPDDCPVEMTAFLAPLAERESDPPGQPFTPPADTFTVPDVLPGVYQVLLACPSHGLGGFRFEVTPASITANPNFAG